MKREFHVRICESVGVRFPRATRPDPARTIPRSFSSFRFLGFAQRLGAGGAG